MLKVGWVLVPVISTALALGVCETVLRWGGWGGSPVELHSKLLQYDPDLGWKKQPSAQATYRWQGRSIVETSNSRGARSPEFAAAADSVLLLGDSFCEGYLVSDDEVFSAVLERDRPDLQAINHGVAGYSTDQQLLLFRELIQQYSPNTTLLLFFDNDVWFNAQAVEYRSAKPLFTLTEGQLVLGGVPVPRADKSVVASPSAGRSSEWRLLRLMRDALQQIEPAGNGGPLEPVDEFLVYRRSPPPEIMDAWELTAALLGQLQSEVAAAGSEFAVFYVPSVAAVDDDAWAQTKERYEMSDADWDIHQVERDLTTVCARLGIVLISPTERFRSAASASNSLYYRRDGHWNPQGHELTAKIISEFLTSQ
jgi:hypothetical protein